MTDTVDEQTVYQQASELADMLRTATNLRNFLKQINSAQYGNFELGSHLVGSYSALLNWPLDATVKASAVAYAQSQLDEIMAKIRAFQWTVE